MRQFVVKQLNVLGYSVIEAESADAARVPIDQGVPVDIMITDIVMAGSMDGIEMARHVAQCRRNVGILLMSGFPQTRCGDRIPREFTGRLRGKPLHREQLGAAVRNAIDARRSDAGSGGRTAPPAGSGVRASSRRGAINRQERFGHQRCAHCRVPLP